ncbi:MAG: hypothetical protein ABJL17_02695 [Parvibaculum sp.]|uniref:hypothetical protein n=1 Tax=Parvibaculum sp. TaxID=2024848 RepID=UPI00326771CB
MAISKAGCRLTGLVCIGLLLAACVKPASNFDASSELTAAVRAHEPVTEKGRVHFFLGLVDSSLMIFGPMSNVQPADLISGGQVVGGVNKGQVLVLDFEPGDYEFAWGERVEDGHGMVSSAVPVSISAGDMIYLRADWRPSTGAAIAGIVGAIADPPRALLLVCSPSECASEIDDLHVVVASQ